MKKVYGMSKAQWNDYIMAMSEAGINPEKGKRPDGSEGGRIMQTIGHASASAGTHGKDGVDSYGYDYSSCTDIRSRDLTQEQIDRFRLCAMKRNFLPYHRKEGSFADNQHIHMIYIGQRVSNKTVKRQVVSFLNKRNGLVNDNIDEFLVNNLSGTLEQNIRATYLKFNRSYSMVNPLNWLTNLVKPKEEEVCCLPVENDYGLELTEEV